MKKSNSIKRLVAVALFATFATAGHAQLTQSFYLNGTLPTGQFNDKITLNETLPVMGRDQIGQNANVGLGATYRIGYRFDIGYGEVTPFAEGSFYWNRIKGSSRDAYDNQRSTDPHYFNIPISIGINYRYPVTNLITPYAEIAMGYDFFSITGEGWKDKTGFPYYRYNAGNSLCWQIGAGTHLGDYVSVGLTYYGLGKHMIDYNTKHSQGLGLDPNATTVHRRIGLLAIRIGFHL